MDPITRASRAFLAESKLFWRSRRGRVLRMEAARAHRKHLVKTLRLAESAPENRWPLFLYEAPFVDACSYWSGLAESIGRDYACIREGATEEGVALTAFALVNASFIERLGPVERAAVHIERAAALLGERLDGVLVALVPPRLPACAQWSASLAALARVFWSDRVRVAVFDTPDGLATAALGTGARFVLDDAALGAYLQRLGPRSSAGPSRQPPAAVVDAEDVGASKNAMPGKSPRSRDAAAQKLRALLIDAAQRVSGGECEAAARLYREAVALCTEGGLILEEAMVRIAFGGMCVAAGSTELAVKSFVKAAAIAQAEKVWSLACQAWLGAGGAHRMRHNHTAAAQAYETAAAMASHAEIPLLQIEALRLCGTCHLAAGLEDKAAEVWRDAVRIGSVLDPEIQRAGPLADVETALKELLEHHSGASRRTQTCVGRDLNLQAKGVALA